MAKQTPEFEDYWNEFQDIEKDDNYHEEEEVTKTPDEGEIEAAWLTNAGYGHLTSSYQDGQFIDEGILKEEIESLTRTQAAAVRRRVNTLNATLRRKDYKHKHVREVFHRPNELPTNRRLPLPLPEEEGPTDQTSPTSPTFPLRPITRHGRKNSRDKVFRRSSGNYSMSGCTEGAEQGVEILTIQTRAGARRSSRNGESAGESVGESVLPSISDNDITLDLKGDDCPLSPGAKLEVDNLGDQKRADHADDMPNFILVKDSLGVTKIGDLGSEDMARCRSLALIELTALFDIYNITYSKRKGKRKVKDVGLFGVPLQVLCEHDSKRSHNSAPYTVPLIFQQIIHCLEETGLEIEGILRVPGSAVRIKNLRQQIEEKFLSGSFSWDGVRPNDAAALLKQFLRELPNPLLSYDYIEAFQQVEKIPDKKQKLQALNLLVLLLADVHRDTLKVLVQFLNKIVEKRQHNKMTVNNVAMIIAPNLFRARKKQAATEFEVNSAVGMSNIVKMLVKYQNILWTIPSFMITQIRHQYSSEQNRKTKEKSKINIFGKKPDKSELYKKTVLESEAQDGFIRVQAPSLSKVGATVQLTDQVTAGDIVDKFKKRPMINEDPSTPGGRFAEINTFLYEVGGNIGERCLDHSAKMICVYRVNPTAEWIIKNRPIVV